MSCRPALRFDFHLCSTLNNQQAYYELNINKMLNLLGLVLWIAFFENMHFLDTHSNHLRVGTGKSFCKSFTTNTD